MKLESYYDIKAGCLNCGQEEFYKIARGYEFLSFDHKENNNTGQHLYSRTRLGLDDESQLEEPTNCRNCRMPFLDLRFWQKSDLSKVKVTANEQ